MPAGDLVVSNYQYEYRNLLMGAGTQYLVESIEGLYSTPDIKDFSMDRDDKDGSSIGRLLYGPRHITMQVQVLSAEGLSGLARQQDYEAKMLALQAAFARVAGVQPFVFLRPGRVKTFVNARCTRREVPIDYHGAVGYQKAVLELTAPDPLLYSMNYATTPITIAGGASTNSGTVTNAGNYPSRPVLSIAGPTVNPRIANAGDGNRSIKIDMTVNAGQTLVIDIAARTVLLDGVDNYDKVRSDNQWWQLAAGAQTISYSRTGTSGSSTLSVLAYDTWI